MCLSYVLAKIYPKQNCFALILDCVIDTIQYIIHLQNTFSICRTTAAAACHLCAMCNLCMCCFCSFARSLAHSLTRSVAWLRRCKCCRHIALACTYLVWPTETCGHEMKHFILYRRERARWVEPQNIKHASKFRAFRAWTLSDNEFQSFERKFVCRVCRSTTSVTVYGSYQTNVNSILVRCVWRIREYLHKWL